MFRPGSSEIVAGRAIAQRFSGAGLNETLRFGGREWTVVGLFDAGGSGFDSEIWGDADQMMQAFRRNAYSVTVLKLVSADRFPAFRARLEADPRLTVEAKRETVFYAEQSELLANFIRILGLTLSVIFSFGAIIGAMITMYAAVSNRTAEIGTLRALGFQRRSMLAAFLLESLFLSPARRRDRALPRVVHATRERVDHELAVVRGDRLPLFAHATHRHPVACVRGLHGTARRRVAGRAGGAAQDRGRAAGGVGSGRQIPAIEEGVNAGTAQPLRERFNPSVIAPVVAWKNVEARHGLLRRVVCRHKSSGRRCRHAAWLCGALRWRLGS